MNSRGSVNDDIVNFSTDLANSLNQFDQLVDTKEPLLSFPFDHLYACHSQTDDRRQTLQIAKEVEIAHCVVRDDPQLTAKIASLEKQNKKLKDLLIYHLDLIQQQNDLMSKKEKVHQSLRQECAALKAQLAQGARGKVGKNAGTSRNSPHVPTATITSGSYKNDTPSTSSNYFNSLNQLLLPKKPTTCTNTYVYNPDNIATKSYEQDAFDLVRNTGSDLPSYLAPHLEVPSILEGTLVPDNYTMIDNNKKIVGKKQAKQADTKEPGYTVTTNSGNQRIQRNRKRPSGVGSLNRMTKTSAKSDSFSQEKSDNYEPDHVVASKKPKLTAKSKNTSSKYPYHGSLSERFQLIDTTPTGEDPYLIGEAEMRAQSPIPKLMLQKTNHGRVKVCTDTTGGVTSTVTATTPTRRIYDRMCEDSTGSPRTRANNKVDTSCKVNLNDVTIIEDQEIDVVKTDDTEEEIDWRIYPTEANAIKTPTLCEFTFATSSDNLVKIPLDITKMSFPDFFEPSPGNDSPPPNEVIVETEQPQIPPETITTVTEKNKKRVSKTIAVLETIPEDTSVPATAASVSTPRRGSDAKRGRKRALSSTTKQRRENNQKGGPKNRGRKANRGGIRLPLAPGMTTRRGYHTHMCGPDLGWYVGLDPDVKKEDVESDNSAVVEVPRWREKVYTPLYCMEGTENLDDKVFEKRHQKYEAEERRQLRWHMRRIREQRQVERLRQRQRDPWNNTHTITPSDYTFWPQPIRDAETIDITDELPVKAFGEDVPELPSARTFVLPWVRTSKAQRSSKKSKTQH